MTSRDLLWEVLKARLQSLRLSLHAKLLEQVMRLLEQHARVSHTAPPPLGECQPALRAQCPCHLWGESFAACHCLRSAEMILRLRPGDQAPSSVSISPRTRSMRKSM